jgi:hypothetical protein
MSVEIMVVDTMIVRWQEEWIFWRYPDDEPWYNCYGDNNPWRIVDNGSEPVAMVVTIPEASKEIYTEYVWYHIDVSLTTGNDNHFRWRGELQRWWRWSFSLFSGPRGRRSFWNGWRWRRWNVNIHIHLGRTNNRHGNNKN